MSTASVLTPTAERLSPMQRHQFLIRRLHSLTGVVPLGVFVNEHLFTNMHLATGTFQHEVDFIHSLPGLLIIEVFGIWLPLGFHAAIGLYYTFTKTRLNVAAYPYESNWRYTLHRLAGLVALVFIFVHIATMRWRWNLGVLDTPFFAHGPAPDHIPLAQASVALALQQTWWVIPFYVVGVMAVIFHWSNGLWTACITWGLTVTVAAQRRMKFVAAAMFLVLTVFAAMAIWGAATYETTEQEREAMSQMMQADKQNGVEPNVHPEHISLPTR